MVFCRHRILDKSALYSTWWYVQVPDRQNPAIMVLSMQGELRESVKGLAKLRLSV